MPKVSIVIPVYNVEEYLRDCLDSIINQTLKDIEIICINDGSTDNSLQILEEYAQKDNRIILLEQENQGQGIARNNGIAIAKGKYIGFVDSDDFISKDYFKALYETIILEDSDIVFTDNIIEFENKNQIKEQKNKKRSKTASIIVTPQVVDKYMHNCVIWTKLYKTSMLKENNIYFVSKLKYEDLLYYYAVMIYSKRISFCNEGVYYYRKNPAGTTRKAKTEDNLDMLKIFEEIYKLFDKNNLLNTYELPYSWLIYRKTQNPNYKRYREEILKLIDKLNLSKEDFKKNSKLKAMLYAPTRFIYILLKNLF